MFNFPLCLRDFVAKIINAKKMDEPNNSQLGLILLVSYINDLEGGTENELKQLYFAVALARFIGNFRIYIVKILPFIEYKKNRY
jgi:hypothetical protein